MMRPSVDGIVILPLPDAGDESIVRRRLLEIFHLSRGGGEFPSPAERRAFERRWLTTYLDRFPQSCFVAVDGDGSGDADGAAGRTAVGYLVGVLRPPEADPILDEQGYHRHFAAVTERAPAHLHINIAPEWRSHGIGGRLVRAFLDLARAEGAAGVHVVTAEKARNVAFYRRVGFADAATADVGGRTLVCLIRELR
ncbi:MAG: GNAT family N-acetyltransferase [Rhizobiales bacterium]|nr:GNAT family N-acetyltransferase [Hyphomicrobiales bacterium]